MPVPSFTTTCLGNRVIARDIYEFALKKPEGFSFKAGQFVLFDVPLLDNSADIQTRAFSIASAPHEPDLLFVAKMKEGGRASRWIAESLKEGSSVRLQGPFGVFTLHPENAQDYLFVATSTGVAPFRSHIADALHQGEVRHMDLVYCVRSEEDLFWHKELSEIAANHPQLSIHTTLSAGSEGWKGHRGRVQTVTKEAVADAALRQVYICGSPAMTTEMKKMCLEEWKIDRKDLHVEGYI
ncbi:MAG: FAD-dependent oxidoreductase [Patescibacteria group bacterium]